jgi:hypothetical protein
MTALHLEQSHFEMGLAPVADFSGADPVYTDVINFKNHGRLQFIVVWGVGATGTTKFTVEACDDLAASNVSAIPFWYRNTTAAGTPGTATLTDASTGFTNTAGSDQIIEIEVLPESLNSSGYGYVRLKLDEVTNSPVLGGILVQLLDPRNATKSPPSAVV